MIVSYSVEPKQNEFAPLGTLCNGGPGSGNFGHLGRKGKVGGSSTSGNTFSVGDLYQENEFGFPELSSDAISSFQQKMRNDDEWEFESRQYELNQYQSAYYKEINQDLRAGKTKALEDRLPFVTNAFDMSFKENVQLYRGENSSTNHWSVKAGQPAPKSLIKGLVSTSIIPEVADMFADKGGKYETFIKLNLKKGKKFVIPQLYTGDLASEAEILLPPNTKMMVKSIKEHKLNDGRIRQEVELDVG